MNRCLTERILALALIFAIAPCAMQVSAAAPDTSVTATRGAALETVYHPDCTDLSGP